MNSYKNSETLSELTLSEVAKLQNEHEIYQQALDNLLRLPEELSTLSAYNKAQVSAKYRRQMDAYEELEQKVKENGYKSLATAVYGLLKSVRTDLVPRKYLVAPAHHIAGKTTAKKAQKQWEDILPLLNELLDDPLLNEADWRNLDEAIHTDDFEAFHTWLLSIKRKELSGEFDKPEVDEAIVYELLEERLLPARQRIGLEPSRMLPSAEARISHDLRFESTGCVALDNTTAIPDLARQQLDAMTPEDRAIYRRLFC